jgi:hypothetical protein
MTDVLNSLVVYWLKDGGADKFLVPPLEDSNFGRTQLTLT